jgi:hypothetical protein
MDERRNGRRTPRLSVVACDVLWFDVVYLCLWRRSDTETQANNSIRNEMRQAGELLFDSAVEKC